MYSYPAHAELKDAKWSVRCSSERFRWKILRVFSRESQSKIPNWRQRATGMEGGWKFVLGVGCVNL